VIATSLLVPLEIYELVRNTTAWKAGGLAASVLIVGYLVDVLCRLHRQRAPA
jgi:uncharacterized membrane protein (DUF2068 family)